MTIRIDTLNNARAALAASGPWGRLAMGEAHDLATRTNVVGVAESWKGAKALEGKTGATSYSARAALNQIRDGRLVLDGNTIVLYDEGERMLAELQDACEEAGARLVQLARMH